MRHARQTAYFKASRITAFLGFILLLNACSQVVTTVANLPSQFHDIQVHQDLAYGEAVHQRLDVYIPSTKPSEHSTLPVVVFFFGGSWNSGDKSMYRFIADRFAQQGYITVIPNYALYPEHQFPSFVEDSAAAIAWTAKEIHRFGGDSSTLFLVGHSAGAYNAALVSSDPQYLAAHGYQASALITAVAGLAGPYDFEPNTAELEAIFAPAQPKSTMKVSHFIKGNEPPMLLLWGEQDELVGRRNIDRLEAKINENNGKVQVITYPSLNHVGLISDWMWMARSSGKVVDDVIQFLRQQRQHEMTPK